MSRAGRRLGGARRRTVLGAVVLGIAVLAFVATALVWQLRVFVVQSPSMGVAAPVGSLVIVSGKATPTVGSVMTFHPSPASDRTYTHRVRSIGADGIVTQGDLNGTPDPWTVRPEEIVGRAVAIIPGGGYALRIACLTAIAGLTAVGATRTMGDPFLRRSIRRNVTCLALAGAIAFVRPLSGFLVLAVSGGAKTVADVVSTSVLPTVVHPRGGGSGLELAYGRSGEVAGHPEHGALALYSGLSLPWWGWLLVAAVCLVPTALALAEARRYRAAHR